MKPSDFIRQLEGCRLRAYQDRGGVWTIGWGTTGPGVVEGLEWTQEQCDLALEMRLANDLQRLDSILKPDLSENQLSAVMALVYNIGLGAFETSTILRRLNAYDFNGAADAWIDSLHIFDKVTDPITKLHVVDDGLHARRIRERALFLLGTQNSPKPYPSEAPTKGD